MAIFNLRRRARNQTPENKNVPEVAKFAPSQAAKNVRNIASNVELMLGDSPLFGDSRSKHETYSLFHRDEVKAGRRLGTGGFSDVYEIEGFELSSESSYSKRQAFSRNFYAKTAARDNGESRYVMKHLRTKLMNEPKKFQMAASDLAVEAQFLSSLEHPHILKLRGWSAESTNSYKSGSHDGYFLILDRLHGDLCDKIQQWKTMERKQISSRRNRRKALAERVKVAYQIACAVDYLHEQGIIFRDLKPNNVGMDADGNVKLFDFGLVREIPEGETDEVFVMSGKVGTRRYMAPEVALNQEYNLKADVYTWACNFYEILGLEKPYAHFSQEMHMELCCKEGYRPEMRREWPESIKALLESSWDRDMHARPTMKQIVESLKSILMELDSANTDVLTIRERRKYSVVLDFPSDFASSMAFKGTVRKQRGRDDATLETSPESLGRESSSEDLEC